MHSLDLKPKKALYKFDALLAVLEPDPARRTTCKLEVAQTIATQESLQELEAEAKAKEATSKKVWALQLQVDELTERLGEAPDPTTVAPSEREDWLRREVERLEELESFRKKIIIPQD